MGQDDTPLVNRVDASTPAIKNIWPESDGDCGGIASRPLTAEDLPDGCTIARQNEVGDGKHRFVLTETPET